MSAQVLPVSLPGQIDDLLDAGWRLLEAGDFNAVERVADAAFDLDPLCPEAHTLLGSLFAAQGDLERSLAAFGESVAIDPGYVDPYLRAAETCLHLGRDAGRARDYLEHAREACIESDMFIDIALLEIDALLLEGKHDEVADRVGKIPDEAIRENPELAFMIGRSLFEIGRSAEARPLLEIAVGQSNAPSEIHYFLGLTRQANGDHAGAMAELLRSLDVDAAGPEFPWSVAPNEFENVVRGALKTVAKSGENALDGAVVLTHRLPPPELIIDGVDPRAPLLVDIGQPGARPFPALFVYQRNVERVAAGANAAEQSRTIHDILVDELRFFRKKTIATAEAATLKSDG